MDFWWRVLPFFVLCHFCGLNGSKVTSLDILALQMASVSDIIPINYGSRLIKSYFSIYWTDRDNENIGEMSPWPPFFPHCAVLPCADIGLQTYLMQLQLWSRHWSATFFLVAECKRFSDSPFVTGHFEVAFGYFTLKIIIYLLLYTCTPSPVVALTKHRLGAI